MSQPMLDAEIFISLGITRKGKIIAHGSILDDTLRGHELNHAEPSKLSRHSKKDVDPGCSSIFGSKAVAQADDQITRLIRTFKKELFLSVLSYSMPEHLGPIGITGVQYQELRKLLIPDIIRALYAARRDQLIEILVNTHSLHEGVGEEIADTAGEDLIWKI